MSSGVPHICLDRYVSSTHNEANGVVTGHCYTGNCEKARKDAEPRAEGCKLQPRSQPRSLRSGRRYNNTNFCLRVYLSVILILFNSNEEIHDGRSCWQEEEEEEECD